MTSREVTNAKRKAWLLNLISSQLDDSLVSGHYGEVMYSVTVQDGVIQNVTRKETCSYDPQKISCLAEGNGVKIQRMVKRQTTNEGTEEVVMLP